MIDPAKNELEWAVYDITMAINSLNNALETSPESYIPLIKHEIDNLKEVRKLIEKIMEMLEDEDGQA